MPNEFVMLPDYSHAYISHPRSLHAGDEPAEERRFRDVCYCLRHCSERHRRAAAEALATYGERAVAPLRLALWDSDPAVRTRALRALQDLGVDCLPILVEVLGDKKCKVRPAAAGALGECGLRAVDPLCGALSDPDPDVRSCAARALGEIGDPRAIQPLLAALRRGFVGGSGRSNLWIGLAIVAFLILLPVAFIGGSLYLKAGGCGGLLNVVFQGTAAFFRRRRAQNAACLAITGALATLAEKDPRPELSRIVPDLHAVSADRVQFDPQTRQASREAARRIGELTAGLEALPLAAGPTADLSALPQPAMAPDPDSERLPRAVGLAG